MLVVSGTRVNGVLTYCRELAKHLTTSGHEVFIVTRSGSWLLQEQNKLPAVSYSVCELNRNPWELRRFAKFVRSKRIDIVHTHMSRANFFGVLLKLFCRVPVVATAHACNFQPHWRFNNFVIATSDFILQQQRKLNRVSISKSKTIHCFVDTIRFKIVGEKVRAEARCRIGIDEDKFVGCVVGHVGARKGLLVLVQSLPKIIECEPRFTLLIVGNNTADSKYVAKVKAQIKQFDLESHVIWTGVRSDVEQIFQASDVCIVPSLKEPLGLVAVEAGLSGVPVIALKAGGLPEVVQDGQSGLLVREQNSEKLAESVVKVINNLDSFADTTKQVRADLVSKFNPSRLTDGVLEVYRSLIDKP